jgi:anaerobic magnesium-protoporphyrin IX monomethyl ester cyclase
MDVLFVNPNSSKKVYQDLAKDYSAIETPTWALLLAQSCRSRGYKVDILDADAERLSQEKACERIRKLSPKLVCFVVYGQNPNSGTTNMAGAVDLAEAIKEEKIETTIGIVGSHVQSLPYQVLNDEKSFDIIFLNEGVYALWNLLAVDDLSDQSNLEKVKGIGFLKEDKPHLTPPEKVVPQEKMDEHLPGYAWDLLPYDKNPLDLYRSPYWHAEYDEEKRSPFAAIYTSLGCVFTCSFCMINMINRSDNEEIGISSNYSGMRFWSPEFIINEFDKLYQLGVRTLRISDEMFLLNRKYYLPLCKLLKERGYGKDFRMWAYSRIDTIRRPEDLRAVREAGIKWLCLGIEAADQDVRLEVTKGKFKDLNIRDVVKKVHDADIEIIANYIFGLPKDSMETMQKTLDLSLELCTLAWNAYPSMALPGSLLYKVALDTNFNLPKDYSGYSFLAYDTVPLPTEFLTSAEIVKFRDDAFTAYHTHVPFLEKVEKKFGKIARQNIEKMTKLKLKRQILGD